MEDNDKKSELPIHLILGASEYSRVKTETKPRIDKPSDVYLAKSSAADYEQLCNLDVLGLEDSPEADQGSVYGEFIEQLDRSEEGWYESGLLWKPGHGRLPQTNMAVLRV